MLILTAGFGLLIGRIIRTMFKILAYAIGLMALVLLALQYLGLVYIVVNFDFLYDMMQWIYGQSKNLGVAEHLFFWVPMIYGLRQKRLLGFL
ncbi:MAG: FUN14 domain-containing protein [candidate division KSB1 bacterium]|nr:FUN14 domain-containing protein [candidate division KSB1 bacterium]